MSTQPSSNSCQVCHLQPHKYKCPSCKLPYCSVGCFKTHKANSCGQVDSTSKATTSAPSLPLSSSTNTLVYGDNTTNPDSSVTQGATSTAVSLVTEPTNQSNTAPNVDEEMKKEIETVQTPHSQPNYYSILTEERQEDKKNYIYIYSNIIRSKINKLTQLIDSILFIYLFI